MTVVHTPLSFQFKNEDEKRMAFEQYKILVESLHKLNETRENANNFWIGVNGVGTSAIAYLRDAGNIAQHHKYFLLWTLIVIGILVCLSWLSYLATIKRSLATRNQLLVAMERGLPLPLFSQVFSLSQESPPRAELTHREMVVPGLFLIGYLFFAVLLFFFTQEVVPVAS